MKGLEEFIETARKAYPYEAAGFIFTDGHEWHIMPVKAIPHDFDKDGWPEGFKFDRTDKTRVERKAKKLGLKKIGVIHSHPIIPLEYPDPSIPLHIKYNSFITPEEHEADWQEHPSEIDLKFMRKYKQKVRGIIVINEQGEVRGIRFHDKNDNDVIPDSVPPTTFIEKYKIAKWTKEWLKNHKNKEVTRDDRD